LSGSCPVINLYKVESLADINLFVLKFAEYLIDHYDIVQEYVESVNKSKIIIKDEMEIMDIETIMGHTNFVHIKIPEKYDPQKIETILRNRGYLVRIYGKGLPAALEGCIRITVGPMKQMKEFVKVLIDILEEKKVKDHDRRYFYRFGRYILKGSDRRGFKRKLV